MLDGYLIAYLNLDEVIRIIREEDEPKASADRQASARPTCRPTPSSTCASRSLRRLEEMEIRAEHDALSKEQRD